MGNLHSTLKLSSVRPSIAKETQLSKLDL